MVMYSASYDWSYSRLRRMEQRGRRIGSKMVSVVCALS